MARLKKADPIEGLEAAREKLAKAERVYRECLHACFDYRHVSDRDIARAAGLTRQRVNQLRRAAGSPRPATRTSLRAELRELEKQVDTLVAKSEAVEKLIAVHQIRKGK